MSLWEGKKYKLESSSNFDEYMKELGVGFIYRKMGNQIKPTVDLVNEEGEFILNTTSTFKSSSIKFKIGEEFEEETVDGRKVKSICTFDGENKLIHTQKGEKPTTIVREFKQDEMIAVMTIGDTICTRTYKAI